MAVSDEEVWLEHQHCGLSLLCAEDCDYTNVLEVEECNDFYGTTTLHTTREHCVHILQACSASLWPVLLFVVWKVYKVMMLAIKVDMTNEI